MSDAEPAVVLAELHYADPEAALDWLAVAFGFEPELVVKNPVGDFVFARVGFRGAAVAILPEQPPRLRSPRTTGGVATQSVQVRMIENADVHCDRARAAGAEIISEPEDHVFGDRAYLVADLEGHVWNFGQRKEAGGRLPEGWQVQFGT
jgi:uncharacterized glyoxalase superfamily protein PhnB